MGGSGRTFSLTEEASADVNTMLPASNAEEMETAMAGAALLPMRVVGEARSAATASERSSSVVPNATSFGSDRKAFRLTGKKTRVMRFLAPRPWEADDCTPSAPRGILPVADLQDKRLTQSFFLCCQFKRIHFWPKHSKHLLTFPIHATLAPCITNAALPAKAAR